MHREVQADFDRMGRMEVVKIAPSFSSFASLNSAPNLIASPVLFSDDNAQDWFDVGRATILGASEKHLYILISDLGQNRLY